MSELNFTYLECENCCNDDGIEIEDNDPVMQVDGMFECYYCGGHSRLELTTDGSLRAAPEYCRHSRSFEENCVRCEVEGLEFPA